MTPELKAKWVAALRSGEYEQGPGCLRRTLPDGSHKYCCLGVLCDISGLGSFNEDDLFVLNDHDEFGDPITWETELGYNPDLLDDCAQATLIDMNDGVRDSEKPERDQTPARFSEIADYIERNL